MRNREGRNKRNTPNRKPNRKRVQSKVESAEPEYELDEFKPKKCDKPLEPQTEAQSHYMMAIERGNLTFGTGPAGTGKTYVCGAMAADALAQKTTRRIVITRPAVEAGEKLGFLPGELDDKFAPFLDPFRDVLNERLGKSYVDYLIKVGRIEAAPLAYMRGKTFKDCWIILDEAQNTTKTQMKLFLTRIGNNSNVIVNGDMSQKDIREQSGLDDAVGRLSHLHGVNMVSFGVDDIVRSGLAQDIVRAYEG
tara:strand:- start:9054 stop:9803 length:750 start_codon:yes stop_codon:yes gene_type:complete